MSVTDSFVYAPHEAAFDADPHPMYRYLRENHPVFLWEGTGVYLVSRYADITAVLTNPRFRMAAGAFLANQDAPRTEAEAWQRKLMRFSFFGYDEATHARVRRLVVPAFTGHAVARLRDGITAIVTDVLDGIGHRDAIDAIADFAALIPVRVTSMLLGIPDEHADLFRRFAQALIATSGPWVSPEDFDAQVAVFPEAVEMVTRLIEERRVAPGADQLSRLVQAHDEGDRLSTDELLGVLSSLIVAGSDTATYLIAFAVKTLLEHPDVLAEVVADPALLPGAISESARFESFSKHGIARLAPGGCELRGVPIPEGSVIVLLTTAALRDPDRFPDPDRFDIHRAPTNLMFGAGGHFCFGHTLAKLETEIALTELLRRYPALALDGAPVFRPNMMLRFMESLPLRLSTGGIR